MSTLLSAVVKHPPGRVFPSRYADKPDQRSVTLELGGSTADCWFDVGSDLEFLQKGDRVFATAKTGTNGKPRADIHLDETLAAELQRRRAAAGVPPSPSSPGPQPSVPQSDRWSEEHRQALFKELQRRAKVLKTCHDQILKQFEGDESVEMADIAGYAIALYNDLSKLF